MPVPLTARVPLTPLWLPPPPTNMEQSGWVQVLVAAAAAYFFGRFQSRAVGPPPPAPGSADSAAGGRRGAPPPPPPGDFKLALCVRTDLGMRKGKMAAQAGHAAVGAYAALVDAGDAAGWGAAWRRRGEAKIALAVGSEGEIRTLEAAGKRAGVGVYVVVDAGRTQIAAVRFWLGGGAVEFESRWWGSAWRGGGGGTTAGRVVGFEQRPRDLRVATAGVEASSHWQRRWQREDPPPGVAEGMPGVAADWSAHRPCVPPPPPCRFRRPPAPLSTPDCPSRFLCFPRPHSLLVPPFVLYPSHRAPSPSWPLAPRRWRWSTR